MDSPPLEGFDFSSDLMNLGKVSQVEAPEAVVFYASRLVDAMSSLVLHYNGIAPSRNLFSDLGTLEGYSLIPRTINCWAHTLRRIGNDVRHLIRSVDASDSILSIALVDRCVSWFRASPKIPIDVAAALNSMPNAIIPAASTMEAIAACESAADRASYDTDWSQKVFALPGQNASVMSALIEMVLDRDDMKTARQLIDECEKRGWNSLRLQQLSVLERSRSENFAQGLQAAKEVLRTSRSDEETLGIVGGLHKRIWNKHQNGQDLARSHQLYRKGWELSHHVNVYLGINAAATAIWLGALREGAEIASLIEGKLNSRKVQRQKLSEQPNVALSIWDQLTLAEAQLQQEKFDASFEAYRIAAVQHPQLSGAIGVALRQADRLLAAIPGADAQRDRWRQLLTAPPKGS